MSTARELLQLCHGLPMKREVWEQIDAYLAAPLPKPMAWKLVYPPGMELADVLRRIEVTTHESVAKQHRGEVIPLYAHD